MLFISGIALDNFVFAFLINYENHIKMIKYHDLVRNTKSKYDNAISTEHILLFEISEVKKISTEM